MKKTIYLLLVVLTSLTLSCSSDDDSSGLNEIGQKLVGQWYFEDPQVVGYDQLNSFIFKSNGEVTYRYWTGTQTNTFYDEVGYFSLNGDILTMTYPEDVVYVFVQKVIFLNDNIVEFVEVEGFEDEAYDGVYYREH